MVGVIIGVLYYILSSYIFARDEIDEVKRLLVGQKNDE